MLFLDLFHLFHCNLDKHVQYDHMLLSVPQSIHLPAFKIAYLNLSHFSICEWLPIFVHPSNQPFVHQLIVNINAVNHPSSYSGISSSMRNDSSIPLYISRLSSLLFIYHSVHPTTRGPIHTALNCSFSITQGYGKTLGLGIQLQTSSPGVLQLVDVSTLTHLDQIIRSSAGLWRA